MGVQPAKMAAIGAGFCKVVANHKQLYRLPMRSIPLDQLLKWLAFPLKIDHLAWFEPTN